MDRRFVVNRMRHIIFHQQSPQHVQVEFSYIGSVLKIFLGHVGGDIKLKRIMVPSGEIDSIIKQLNQFKKEYRWKYGDG